MISYEIRNGILYNTNSSEDQRNIIIPQDVELIWFDAFNSCKEIEHISLNEKLRCIKGGVFLECTKLKSIYIPRSVVKIHVFTDEYIENCKLANSKGGFSEFRNSPHDFKVIGCKGSFAEKYCTHFEIPFETIDDKTLWFHRIRIVPR